jgi:hypothetical protein
MAARLGRSRQFETGSAAARQRQQLGGGTKSSGCR